MRPIRVDRDGLWAWEGHPMVHQGILSYLKQHLERDPAGQYWVAVGGARVPVMVEDAPFVVESLRDGPPRARLDDGREESLADPVRLVATHDNRLYLPVQGGHDRALLSRQAHQQVWAGLDEDASGRYWLCLSATRLRVILERA